MSKRLGVFPKGRAMHALTDKQSLIVGAVPMQPAEKLKTYFPRVANELGWTPRRVRAWWNDEARRIDYLEMVALQLKERANENKQRLRDDIERLRSGGSAVP